VEEEGEGWGEGVGPVVGKGWWVAEGR
jgi:hypothetical protein